MNIKSARIVGVLQDWDICDNRFDIEQVNVNVPLHELESFTDEQIENMVSEVCYYSGGYNWHPLEDLLFNGIENGWFVNYSRWEWEDPCELKLEIEEEEC